jgi:hypothetical protein
MVRPKRRPDRAQALDAIAMVKDGGPHNFHSTEATCGQSTQEAMARCRAGVVTHKIFYSITVSAIHNVVAL